MKISLETFLSSFSKYLRISQILGVSLKAHTKGYDIISKTSNYDLTNCFHEHLI
ncbi:hypothetical protein [Petrotoga sp. 9PW.55.5.1]|uniref:hypothetical protein n=1 Tax=Petrotoga sp. 9PW.55.5.1 TaxID=1308979 RepID=UPI001F42229C|nr:hypothetical protein [Petrotoga sp. 9PW.55.5.1]